MASEFQPETENDRHKRHLMAGWRASYVRKAATPEGAGCFRRKPNATETLEANLEESASVPRGFGSATSYVRFSAGAGAPRRKRVHKTVRAPVVRPAHRCCFRGFSGAPSANGV
ncbi:protein FMC1 homolog isoform X3 [Bubalus bubalis]|uniref:protein FMC1 homolog isoform X3 n=1 Tax=Bubalus bubalis TaxID=89462 RepID=UPI001D125D3B|nr:protein FMC1 homolog isoform X3 [Bubalus bubalis]